MKVSIITTTINFPYFVKDYYDSFHSTENINFIIVADNKTIQNYPDAGEYANQYDAEFWTPADQEMWLMEHFPFQEEKIKRLLIPENDTRRRNFGYLRAKELDSDVIITIDDDNYPIGNWLGDHLSTLGTKEYSYATKSDNGVINPCKTLAFSKPQQVVYSRGYPLSKVFQDSFVIYDFVYTKCVLNVGLWSNKPDVDSWTNIIYPNLCSEGAIIPQTFVAKNNFFPINTQNTAFTKDLSIFHNLYMEPLLSTPMHRYDDIWAGLFCQKLANELGDACSFGIPVVEHRRNTHNYSQDLRTEMLGAMVNSKLWETVMKMPIESHTYTDGFLEIAENLKNAYLFNNFYINDYFNQLAESMELWVELLEKL